MTKRELDRLIRARVKLEGGWEYVDPYPFAERVVDDAGEPRSADLVEDVVQRLTRLAPARRR